MESEDLEFVLCNTYTLEDLIHKLQELKKEYDGTTPVIVYQSYYDNDNSIDKIGYDEEIKAIYLSI